MGAYLHVTSAHIHTHTHTHTPILIKLNQIHSAIDWTHTHDPNLIKHPPHIQTITLSSLRHYLRGERCRKRKHLTIFLKRKRAIVGCIKTVSKTSLGKFLRDGVEHRWAFASVKVQSYWTATGVCVCVCVCTCVCESVCVCVCAFMLYALNFDNMYL